MAARSSESALDSFLLSLVAGRDEEIVGTYEALSSKEIELPVSQSVRSLLKQKQMEANSRMSDNGVAGLDEGYLQRLRQFRKSYAWLESAFEYQSWVALPWSSPLPKSQVKYLVNCIHETDRNMVFVADAWNFNWGLLSGALGSRYALLIVPDTSILLRLLGQASFCLFVDSENIAVYLGDQYPDEQFKAQAWIDRLSDGFEICTLPSLNGFSENENALATTLESALAYRELGESEEFNSLYWLCLDCCRLGAERLLGTFRAAALERVWSNRGWVDRYKGGGLASVKRLPFGDLFEGTLDSVAPVGDVRSRSLQSRPIKICHLTTQIISEGHAPTKLVRSLCEHANRLRFEPSVYSVESLARWKSVYPSSVYMSPSSVERGNSCIRSLESDGVKCSVFDPGINSYLEGARQIAQELLDAGIDVLVAHGSDPLIYLVVRLSGCPMKVYVEHSSRPAYSGFEVAICSIAGTAEREQSKFDCWNTRLVDNPYGVDCRAGWSYDPPSLGFSTGCKAITTISNYLEARLSDSFLEAIAAILTVIPNSVYLPIGPVKNPVQLKKRFELFGVSDRVFCMGSTPSPSNMCRVMSLYLNEFPFGGGISILDGMSAGLPVVSMHDPDGPMQAQNGANYIGIDRVLGKDDAIGYVNLAVQLLSDLDMWQEWSNHSIAEYEKRGPRAYVGRFEQIVLDNFER